MEYFEMLYEWLEHSKLYQEFLVYMPSPLNNVYFDLLVLLVFLVWLLQWMIGCVNTIRRRKRLRQKRENLQKAQEEAELEAVYHEREMRQKQDQMNKQMKFLQMFLLYQYMPKEYQKEIEQNHRFYISENKYIECEKNEFEKIMDMLGADEKMKEQLFYQQLEQEQMAEQNRAKLEKKLRTDNLFEEETRKIATVDVEKQKELERRKAVAIKLALREQKRAEKKKRGIFR